MSAAHVLELAASVVLSYVIIDPTRVLAQALFLGRMREQHPELFDAALALANVEASLDAVSPSSNS